MLSDVSTCGHGTALETACQGVAVVTIHASTMASSRQAS
jgi:hypothetical protein